ncbi:MAG: Holliday junction branch migration protein RuvA [Actinobacteria bacterium]|nr:Holliday junction branch migration protein RuvA [Actinomycetota bacterium]
MIASVSGTVLDRRLDSVIVNIGGVGMQVMAAPDVVSSARVGEPISLHTSLVVREESLTLFGFSSNESRELFELIQGVSGFGPRLAFTILSFLTAEQLRTAISSGDTATLTKTPGVGAKGASRLVLELRDRVTSTGLSSSEIAPWEAQIEQALGGLGWPSRDVQSVITTLRGDSSSAGLPIAELLKNALQILGRSK